MRKLAFVCSFDCVQDCHKSSAWIYLDEILELIVYEVEK